MSLYGFVLRKFNGSSRSGEEFPGRGITSGFSQVPKPDQVSDYTEVRALLRSRALLGNGKHGSRIFTENGILYVDYL